jgi:hypothetical protein
MCLLCVAVAVVSRPAAAQIVESAGSRALGMGGAFVAVANDSSATWWNPAALGDGPFLDLALARAMTETVGTPPVRRERVSWFALGTPPVGASYYRFRLTDIRPFSPTGSAAADRQERGAGIPVRSLAASQFGVTLLHTIVPGVHAGTTLKYVRGTLRAGREEGLSRSQDLLDAGEALEGGETESRFDLDVGVLAVVGPVRIGGVGRNLREVDFASGGFTLPRQVRIGAAFDAEKAGGPPLMIAIDADVKAYAFSSGERRVVAVGGEQWLWARRIGVRAGARFNQVGPQDRSATAGISVSPRAGLYLDGHIVRGGSADDRGWGAAARVSF